MEQMLSMRWLRFHTRSSASVQGVLMPKVWLCRICGRWVPAGRRMAPRLQQAADETMPLPSPIAPKPASSTIQPKERRAA